MKKKSNPKEEYFVFSKYQGDEDWRYLGSADTKEEAEDEFLVQHNEPEPIEYIIIKGKQLRCEEGVAIFPYKIIEEYLDDKN
ncbi:MAG TPA: hypothetical protein P5136_00650 [Methanofastidiosum sp.]|nr:hypothetical protein [Methanofastidiosum sp.]